MRQQVESLRFVLEDFRRLSGIMTEWEDLRQKYEKWPDEEQAQKIGMESASRYVDYNWLGYRFFLRDVYEDLKSSLVTMRLPARARLMHHQDILLDWSKNIESLLSAVKSKLLLKYRTINGLQSRKVSDAKKRIAEFEASDHPAPELAALEEAYGKLYEAVSSRDLLDRVKECIGCNEKYAVMRHEALDKLGWSREDVSELWLRGIKMCDSVCNPAQKQMEAVASALAYSLALLEVIIAKYS